MIRTPPSAWCHRTSEQYGLSPDFRRQLKARMMAHEMPVQIVLESTLTITEQVRLGEPGTNPLSDRLWNFGTALFYKMGLKPGRPPGRETACVTSDLRIAKSSGPRAPHVVRPKCFLDSGDGIVFVGEFGPWYSRSAMSFISPPRRPRSSCTARSKPTPIKTGDH